MTRAQSRWRKMQRTRTGGSHFSVRIIHPRLFCALACGRKKKHNTYPHRSYSSTAFESHFKRSVRLLSNVRPDRAPNISRAWYNESGRERREGKRRKRGASKMKWNSLYCKHDRSFLFFDWYQQHSESFQFCKRLFLLGIEEGFFSRLFVYACVLNLCSMHTPWKAEQHNTARLDLHCGGMWKWGEK